MIWYIDIHCYLYIYLYIYISSQHPSLFEGIMSTFGTYFPGVGSKGWWDVRFFLVYLHSITVFRIPRAGVQDLELTWACFPWIVSLAGCNPAALTVEIANPAVGPKGPQRISAPWREFMKHESTGKSSAQALSKNKYTKSNVYAPPPPFISLHTFSPLFNSSCLFMSLHISSCLFMALYHLCSSASIFGIKNLGIRRMMQDDRMGPRWSASAMAKRRIDLYVCVYIM